MAERADGMIRLDEQKDGVLIPVQAQPKARRTGLVGLHNGRLKIAVTEPPDKGKANEALLRVLAEILGVRRGDVRLRSGATSAAKLFVVTGLTAALAEERIAARLPADESEAVRGE